MVINFAYQAKNEGKILQRLTNAIYKKQCTTNYKLSIYPYSNIYP